MKIIPMENAEVVLYNNFFTKDESDNLIKQIMDEIIWQQEKIKIYGKEIDIPRQTAWHGDKSYTYSGIKMKPLPWTPALIYIKKKIEPTINIEFNSVLLNLYRNGRDSVGWHSDDEPELGQNPIIGSVSFGGTRQFIFRSINNYKQQEKIDLTHGSFLLMAGKTQHFWQHQIPKTSKQVEPRINLTFRIIY